MTPMLIGMGLLALTVSLVLSARMSSGTRVSHRASVALIGGAGALTIAAATIVPEMLGASLLLKLVAASWIALDVPEPIFAVVTGREREGLGNEK